jgi:hypothetical protein
MRPLKYKAKCYPLDDDMQFWPTCRYLTTTKSRTAWKYNNKPEVMISSIPRRTALLDIVNFQILGCYT